MIPKIIHYCWLSNDPVPEELQHYMATWHKHMPDYEFIKWDFTRFDINSSIWVKEAFENRKFAFAADYIRMYALYTMGGIYMDMDVEVLKPFDELLNRREILGFESESDKPEVAVFGAEKGCEWIKLCVAHYNNRHFISDDGSFDINTLPFVVSNLWSSNGYNIYRCKNIYDIPSESEIGILPSDYFSPKSYRTGKINITHHTYSIHHFAGSWLPLNERIELKFWQFLRMRPHRIMWHLNKMTKLF